MKPWVIWLIKHHMVWLLKALAVLSYPLQLLTHWGDAWTDVRYIIDYIDHEATK